MALTATERVQRWRERQAKEGRTKLELWVSPIERRQLVNLLKKLRGGKA